MLTSHDAVNEACARARLAHVPLASIPAEYIGHARRQLPQLQQGAEPAAGVVNIGAPWNVGKVRIWFDMYTPPASQRRRGVQGLWTLGRAENVSK